MSRSQRFCCRSLKPIHKPRLRLTSTPTSRLPMSPWRPKAPAAFWSSVSRRMPTSSAHRARLTRDEIDQVARLWSLPGERNKNGKAHAIFIADEFDKLLDQATNHEFLFGRGKAPSGSAKQSAPSTRLWQKLPRRASNSLPHHGGCAIFGERCEPGSRVVKRPDAGLEC